MFRKKQTTGHTNELKRDKTKKELPQRKYYSYWLLLHDWCIYLHTHNYSLTSSQVPDN